MSSSGPTRARVKRTVAFALVARDGSLSFTGLFYVSLAPLLAPSVLSAYATPSALGPSGGTVTVTGRVKNARSCQLELLSRQSFPVVYSHNPTTACRNGTFSAHVLIGGNPSPVKRTVAFALVARDGSLSSTGLFYVSLAPLLAPSVLSAYATPSALGPSGGTVTVTGRVKNARSCQLELLSRQSFPVVYSHNPTTACRNGTFSAHVLIGGNPSPVKRTVAFALVASDGSLSFTGLFYVSLAPRPPYLPPPPPPPPPPLPSQYTPGSTGYDVSWPQCQAPGSRAHKIPTQRADICRGRRKRRDHRRFQQLLRGRSGVGGAGAVRVHHPPTRAIGRPGGLRDVGAEVVLRRHQPAVRCLQLGLQLRRG